MDLVGRLLRVPRHPVRVGLGEDLDTDGDPSVDSGSSVSLRGAVVGHAAPVLLHLEPSSCLIFKAAALGSFCCLLRVTNTSTSKVAFKVMISAPQSYTVRPNFGFLAPGQQGILQIHTVGTAWGTSDRFLIRSVAVPSDVLDFRKNDWDSHSAEQGFSQRLGVASA